MLSLACTFACMLLSRDLDVPLKSDDHAALTARVASWEGAPTAAANAGASGGAAGLSFELPGQQYTLLFSAARGGCLTNITDTISGEDVLEAPLELRYRAGAAAAPRSLCDDAGAQLSVDSRSASSLVFHRPLPAGSGAKALRVRVGFDSGTFQVTVAMYLEGEAAAPLQISPLWEARRLRARAR